MGLLVNVTIFRDTSHYVVSRDDCGIFHRDTSTHVLKKPSVFALHDFFRVSETMEVQSSLALQGRLQAGRSGLACWKGRRAGKGGVLQGDPLQGNSKRSSSGPSSWSQQQESSYYRSPISSFVMVN